MARFFYILQRLQPADGHVPPRSGESRPFETEKKRNYRLRKMGGMDSAFEGGTKKENGDLESRF